MLDRDPWPAEEKSSPPPPLVPGWLKKIFQGRNKISRNRRPGKGKKEDQEQEL
jgi:hypothetical protein